MTGHMCIQFYVNRWPFLEPTEVIYLVRCKDFLIKQVKSYIFQCLIWGENTHFLTMNSSNSTTIAELEPFTAS